jgi:hypothetical protein
MRKFNKTEEEIEQWAKDNPPPAGELLTVPQEDRLPAPDEVENKEDMWWMKR